METILVVICFLGIIRWLGLVPKCKKLLRHPNGYLELLIISLVLGGCINRVPTVKDKGTGDAPVKGEEPEDPLLQLQPLCAAAGPTIPTYERFENSFSSQELENLVDAVQE